ncbi:UNVERIFIED_CONTAM: hypothetical protein FKN15_042940 [Acipenser sinensis]
MSSTRSQQSLSRRNQQSPRPRCLKQQNPRQRCLKPWCLKQQHQPCLKQCRHRSIKDTAKRRQPQGKRLDKVKSLKWWQKKKKNIQSEEGEPKRDPGLVFVGSGEKTQSPGLKVADSGGDPQPMPGEELTSSPEAVTPCPEEEGTSTELPQSDYETGSKTGGGTEAEAVAVKSGEAAEKDGADGEEDEGMPPLLDLSGSAGWTAGLALGEAG